MSDGVVFEPILSEVETSTTINGMLVEGNRKLDGLSILFS
ncbi:hypothetical protein Pla100_48250 [Neorhodopirellula pilleata]|uniref:Uncharacterized protein n=1 Tax=Neorhodopirellula pilleata TaxID=2714738 RepID=A0A5C5ZYM3_9BACT|nr:hypothetical protein Pla100_48250 [Neorhodopirellula pilleata]